MIHQILFSDENTIHPILIDLPDNMDIADVYQKVCDLANQDKITCQSDTIPEKYWKQAGATLLKPKTHTWNIAFLNQPDNHGLDWATCRFCNRFECSHCNKYGGITDPDTPADTCFVPSDYHYELIYNNEPMFTFISERKDPDINTVIDVFFNETEKETLDKTKLTIRLL